MQVYEIEKKVQKNTVLLVTKENSNTNLKNLFKHFRYFRRHS